MNTGQCGRKFIYLFIQVLKIASIFSEIMNFSQLMIFETKRIQPTIAIPVEKNYFNFEMKICIKILIKSSDERQHSTT